MASEVVVLIKSKGGTEVVRDLKGIGDTAEKGAGPIGKMTGALGDMAKIAGGFVIGQGLLKLPGMISGATSAAAELEQSIGGVQSIFGESSDAILAWGRDAHEAAGLSQDAFNKLAVPLGAMLKNAGRDMGDATDKTLELTQRAADMAATFGGPVDEAVSAISAMLRGETDPIERYGVSIKAADVSLRALADTGKSTEKDLTPLELQNARLALLMEQTASAAGQFGREADTAAGKSERLKAKQENLAASLGTQLLPLQVRWTQLQVAATDVLTNKLVPAVQVLAEWLSRKLGPALLEGAEKVRTIAGAVREFAWQKLQEFAAWTTGTLVPALQAAGEYIVGRFSEAWATLEPIVSAVLPSLQSIGEVLGQLPAIAESFAHALEPLAGALDVALGWFVNNEAALTGALATIAAVIVGAYVPAVIAWVAAEYAKATAMLASAAAFAVANAPLIAIAAAIGVLVAGIVLLVRHWDTITQKVPALGVAADGFVTGFKAVAKFVTDSLVPALADLWGIFNDKVLPVIQMAISAYLAPLKLGFEAVKAVLDVLMPVLGTLWTVFRNDIFPALQEVSDFVFVTLIPAVQSIVGTVAGVVTDLVGKAVDFLSAGKDLGSNLMEGIKTGLSSVTGFAGDVADAVLSAVKSVLNTYVIDPINRALEFKIPIPGAPDIKVDPPDIPHLAAGGIVSRPTLAVVGDAGPGNPEVVAPLSKLRQFGLGGGAGPGVTIHVHVHGAVIGRSMAEVADELARELGRAVR